MEDNVVRSVVVTAVAPVTWGATYWVTGHALPPDQPLWGGVLRALPAGAVLLALPRRGGRLLHGSWWWRAAVLGCLINAAFFSLVYASAQLLPAGVAATATGASPLVVLALSWALLGFRPSTRAVSSALMGLVGVVLLVATSPQLLDPRGVIIALAGVGVFGLGNVLSQRWTRAAGGRGQAVPAPVTMVTWQLVLSGSALAPVAAVVEGAPPTLDARGVMALAFVSLGATALAFTCWFVGIARLGASAAGLIGLLNPVTGVALGSTLGGERLNGAQLAGLVMVLASIAWGQGRSRSPEPLLAGPGRRGKAAGPGVAFAAQAQPASR